MYVAHICCGFHCFLFFSCLTVAPHFKRASSIGIAETAITHKPLTDVNAGDGLRKPFAEVNQGMVAIAQKPYLGDNAGPVVVNESKCKFVYPYCKMAVWSFHGFSKREWSWSISPAVTLY